MKKVIILFLFVSSLFALELNTNKTINANTILVSLEKSNIENPKLTFLNKNYDFFENPFKKDSYYILLPISYYEKPKKEPIIVSYFENGKKVFKGKNLYINKGDYKTETLSVSSSKVELSQEDKQRVKKEFEETKEIYTKKHPNILWKDDFIYPLDSKITSDFGNARLFNNTLRSYHTGTDFRAPIGTPIKASNSGIVRVAKDRFYGGKSVVIDHGHGVFSGYFHLDEFKVKLGDFVKRGDIIALSGNTGRSTGPHLHFMFKIDDVIVNPLQAIDILNSLKN